MDEKYLNLIHSERVLPTTREVLVQRIEAEMKSGPKAISAEMYPVLKALVERLIPQTDREHPIDIAAELDEDAYLERGDGWRFADMPADKEALELGLTLLNGSAMRQHGKGFARLEANQQDLILTNVQNGNVRWSRLNAKRWFEETLVNATRAFVSHPETLAEIGYSGIAILPNWENIGLNEGEAWEPQAR